ncbi:hypothetical protein evm_008175 [Chilo suppressalis]|nr:hypothetical protein evm_008175 [Chilo suppressalis]
MLLLSNYIESAKLHQHQKPNVNLTDNNFYYKSYKHLNEVCKQKEFLCSKVANSTRVCALRFLNENVEYESFKNTCYLFLINLCEYKDREYHIIHSGYCDEKLTSRKFIKRRLNERHTAVVSETTNNGPKVNATGFSGTKLNGTLVGTNGTTIFGHGKTNIITKSIIRAKPKTTTKFRYEIDETFDDHKCPYFCPNAYSPVCMSVNRGEGKYFKYFTFINHCYADMYYCKHYHELGPAPTRDYEDVQVSPLGWSFCGAFRYLQFARYSEVLSSMGHYGWLAGDYRYSHIMEPHQRMPGYG